jgi:outer membrane protein assembly factor BamB
MSFRILVTPKPVWDMPYLASPGKSELIHIMSYPGPREEPPVLARRVALRHPWPGRHVVRFPVQRRAIRSPAFVLTPASKPPRLLHDVDAELTGMRTDTKLSFGLNVLLVCCAAVTTMMNCPARAPSTPAVPFAGMVRDSLAFFTTATDPKGGYITFVFDWGDGSMSTSGLVPSGDTGYACHSFEGTGVFSIRAKAVNRDGRESDWSEAVEYTATQPPVLPDTILGPGWYGVNRWARFRVVVTDPDGDSVAAKFIWRNGHESAWSGLVASGDTITDSVKYLIPGVWTIQVLLRDKGNTVARSAMRKQVRTTTVAVLWWNEGMETDYEASPTLRVRHGELLIYTVSCEDSVECHGADGSLVWQATPDPNGSFYYAPSLSPDGSRLYVSELWEDALHCYDADDGTLIWTLHDSLCLSGTPAIGPDGEIYIVHCAPYTQLIKVIDEGGSPRIEWRLDMFVWISDGVTLDRNGVIYLLTQEFPHDHPCLVAVSSGGMILWQDSTHLAYSEHLYPPVVDGSGRILTADEDGTLHCFNPDGSFAWSNTEVCVYPGGITVGTDNRIYAVGHEGDVICVEQNGEVAWSVFPGGECVIDNSLCIASDNTIIACDTDADIIFALDFNGDLLWELWALDSIEGAKRTRAPRDEGDECSSPIIGPDGNLYLVSYSGLGLYCVSYGDATLADAPWPTYAHDAARSSWAGRQE